MLLLGRQRLRLGLLQLLDAALECADLVEVGAEVVREGPALARERGGAGLRPLLLLLLRLLLLFVGGGAGAGGRGLGVLAAVAGGPRGLVQAEPVVVAVGRQLRFWVWLSRW